MRDTLIIRLSLGNTTIVFHSYHHTNIAAQSQAFRSRILFGSPFRTSPTPTHVCTTRRTSYNYNTHIQQQPLERRRHTQSRATTNYTYINFTNQTTHSPPIQNNPPSCQTVCRRASSSSPYIVRIFFTSIPHIRDDGRRCRYSFYNNK